MKKVLINLFLLTAVFATFPAVVNAQTQQVCKGANPPPAGWVVTNIYTVYGACGGPPYDLNYQTIVNTTSLNKGTTLEICAWQTIPQGWSLVAPWIYTRYGMCGSYPYTNNVWPIRKN